jgi:hypothetical protein
MKLPGKMIKCQFFEITAPGGHESSRNTEK